MKSKQSIFFKKVRYFIRSIKFKIKHSLINFKIIKGYKPNTQIKKINIGGGEWRRKNWENLDIIFGYKLEDRLLDEFQNNSIELIYSSHCFEHIAFKNLPKIFNSIYEKLAPGGTFRIVVPDIDKLWSIYSSDEKKNYKFYRGYYKENFSIKDLMLLLYGFSEDKKYFLQNSMHLSFFSENSLKLLLSKCGFKKFNKFSFGDSNVDDFKITQEQTNDGFDNPDSRDISLYLEVSK